MRILKKSLAVLASSLLLVGATATAAHADDYALLNGQQLEQTVLRAQMPRTLGNWTQNYYFAGASTSLTRPMMCWSMKGDVRLPAAKNMGGVGYAIGTDTSGWVYVFQYATQAKADAALAAMRSASCADSPMVLTDEGRKVQGQGGSDFTDDTTTGYAAGMTYPQDDLLIFDQRITTQRGLAIIQVGVTTAVPSSTSMARQQQVANRLGSVNSSWSKAAVRAYESFGQGRAR